MHSRVTQHTWPLFLEDKRVNCLTGMGVITIDEYIAKIEKIYRQEGGIDGQRSPLKTKTGLTIRKRMVEDLRAGAVLPPLVLGAVLNQAQIDESKKISSNQEFVEFLLGIDEESLSIIDGMQRTTALKEAHDLGLSGKNPIRVELWISENISSLIYRMLVLNTGQVPWDIKRQLETIYKQIILLIKNEVKDINVLSIDEKERRTDAGSIRSTRIVELFLSFTSRTSNVELKEKVAADFARMDATEVTANNESLQLFVRSIKVLADFDRALSKFSMAKSSIDSNTRFKDGKDLFTSAPASIGFIAAIAQSVLGKPGYDIDFADAPQRMRKVEVLIQKLIETSENQIDFVDFLTLNEKVSRRSGKIGEFERDFFFKAFEHLFANSQDLKNLGPCWYAYQ